jgi:hypothetical protein
MNSYHYYHGNHNLCAAITQIFWIEISRICDMHIMCPKQPKENWSLLKRKNKMNET